MKINIQNYETYFLLYIDNELPVVEKREVERFIKEHPALANELNTLKQTVLAADHILFEEKAILYRYQEMESSLPFGFKQNLYREEAKVVEGFFTRSKIISIASIAAILLLLLGYRSYFIVPINNEKGISKNKNTTIQSLDSKRITSSTANNIIESNLETKYKTEATAPSESNMFTSNNLPLTEETTFIPEETKLIVVANLEPEIRNSKIKESAIISISENMMPATIKNINPNVTIANNLKEIQEEDYENINTEDEDRGVYIANFEIDGDKLRGVTRRINALFRRNKNEKQK
jgi:hypothetical protein